MRWALRAWKPEDIVDLTEIVVIGDDLVAKQVESKLLKKGAQPLYKKDEKSCTYGFKNNGTVHVINIARGRSRALASRNGSSFNLIRRLYGRLRYKTGITNYFMTELPRGIAAARMANIQKVKKLSRKAKRDEESDIYWNLRFRALKRTCLSTLLPAMLLILFVEWLLGNFRRSKTSS